MIKRIREHIKSFIDIPEFYEYFSKPINKGLHYHIGGISELMDITPNISDETIEDIISERLVEVKEDLFTIQYFHDINDDGDVVSKFFHSILISSHKISPNFLLISGFYLDDTEAAVNPVITVIPLGKHPFSPHDESFVEDLFNVMEKDGVNDNFIGYLSSVDNIATYGDCFFFGIDKELDDTTFRNVINDARSLLIDVLYRFLMITGRYQKIKVTPNMELETKGFIDLPDMSTDYYVIKAPDKINFLGFTRKKPEV